MGKPTNLSREFLILTLTQFCLSDLAFLPAQHIQPLTDPFDLLRTFCSEPGFLLPHSIDLLVFRQACRQITIPTLEQLTLCILVQKSKVLILPMDIYEVRSNFFQKR